MHLNAGILLRGDTIIHLSPSEATIAAFLLKFRGTYVPVERLLDHYTAGLPYYREPPTEQIIRVSICKLRKKLAAINCSIENRYSYGYRWLDVAP